MALSRTDYATTIVGAGASITTASFTPPDNSLLVVTVIGMRDADRAFTAANVTISDSLSGTWTVRKTQDNTLGYDTQLGFWTRTVTTGASMTVTATKGAGDSNPIQWAIKVVAYTGYDTGTPTGVTGGANNGPSSGSYNPSLSGSPASSSEVLAIVGGTVTAFGDCYPVVGTGWTTVAAINASSYFGAHLESRTGSTTASVLWDDVLGPSSNDTYYNGVTHFIALEILAAATTTREQEGFRFRNDDGSETGATWASAQDANLTAPLGAKRLRLLANATGDPASAAYTLRYQKNGAGGYTAVPTVSGSSPSLSYGTIGTLTYAGGTAPTSIAPPYPSGITSNSCLVLLIGQKPTTANGGTVTTPSGWTLQTSLTGANDGDTGGYTTTLGADTGNTNIFVYTKDTVTGSESGNLTVTISDTDAVWATIIRFQSSDTCTWSYSAAAGKDTSAGNVSIATGSMTVASGDYVLGAMCIPTDVTTPTQFSSEAFSQSGTTFAGATEIGEPDTTLGNDLGGFICYSSASSGSGSGAVTLSATAGGTTTNVRGPGLVLRIRAVAIANELYVSASSNVTAGGEATTAQLTAPSGKSTSDFVTGRMWDDENGTDTTDITTDDYSEFEWCLTAQSPAVNGDYYEFRVYAGAAALDTYTVTPRWTIGSVGSFIPFRRVSRKLLRASQ